MRRFFIYTAILVALQLATASLQASSPSEGFSANPTCWVPANVCGTRLKRTMVSADSAAGAMAKAQRRNPGWIAIDVRKVGHAKSYSVLLRKNR